MFILRAKFLSLIGYLDNEVNTYKHYEQFLKLVAIRMKNRGSTQTEY